MNLNVEKITASKNIDVNEVVYAKKIIKDAILNNQQCFWPEIIKANVKNVSHETILLASREMQKNGEIRLKEDSYEHAMEYILIK